MVEKDRSGEVLKENPLISKLIAQGAEHALTLRGYVGPSDGDHVRLYPRIGNLQESVEIARSDILHVVPAPQSTLGAVILWVRRDAKIAIRKLESTTATASATANLTEVRKGRLTMRVGGGKSRAAEDDPDPCVSWCDCSICQSTCEILPPLLPR